MSSEFCFISERKCWKCKKIKSRDQFYKDRTDKYGLQKSCKDCNKAASKKWQADHPNYSHEKGVERYANILDKNAYNKKRYELDSDGYKTRKRRRRASYEGRAVELVYSAKERAKRKGLEIDIDADWVKARFEEQGMRCKLTLILFDFSHNKSLEREYNPFAPSLHRINPKEGYTKSNTLLVCVGINLAFNTFGEDIYLQIAKAFMENKSAH